MAASIIQAAFRMFSLPATGEESKAAPFSK